MVQLIHISEGARMFFRSIKIRINGYKRYSGNSIQICEQIIEDCYNKKDGYYQVSNGNYNEFYCRDFGISTDALIELGHKDRVIKTLEYAMSRYARFGKITQIISHGGTPFEFPTYSCDALPFLLRSINRAGAKHLIENYKELWNYEIAKYYEKVFDEKTGLVKKDPSISGMKDYALRISPCYHNCMVAMLQKEIKTAKLPNPFKKYNFKKIIKDNFWRKTHFIDDLSGNDFITGDANIFPFWCGIFNEKSMLKSVIKKIREEGLDYPFPLKYHGKRMKEHEMIWLEFFVKNWEKDTIWMHIGMCYLDIVKRIDPLLYESYLGKYHHIIELHGNFLELFEPNGRLFKTPVFCADDAMVWCSVLLKHLKRIK